MSQHENYVSGCSTSSVFPSPAHSDAAFVHLSKGAHLDWFTSTSMYKLKFLAIVSVIWDFLLSISPFRSFFQLPSCYSVFISSARFLSRSSPD